MDMSDPFSEESFRYASECRRLARLARKPLPPDTMGTVAYVRLLAWFKDVQMHVGLGWQPEFFGKVAGPTRR
jgi:hypothetical protein